jgi:hypothetical protein
MACLLFRQLSLEVTWKSFLKNGTDCTKIIPLIQEGRHRQDRLFLFVSEIRVRTFIDALSGSLTDRYKKNERKSDIKPDTASLLMIIFICR